MNTFNILTGWVSLLANVGDVDPAPVVGRQVWAEAYFDDYTGRRDVVWRSSPTARTWGRTAQGYAVIKCTKISFSGVLQNCSVDPWEYHRPHLDRLALQMVRSARVSRAIVTQISGKLDVVLVTIRFGANGVDLMGPCPASVCRTPVPAPPAPPAENGRVNAIS